MRFLITVAWAKLFIDFYEKNIVRYILVLPISRKTGLENILNEKG